MKKKYYELTQSQSEMRMLMILSQHTQAVSIPFYFVIEDKLDFKLLRRATEIEFERNDALRIRFKGFFCSKQFFISEPDFDGKIEFCDFYGKKAEEEEYLANESKKEFNYKKGDTVRIRLIRTHDDKTGIYVDFFHLIADAYGALITVKDILAVYHSLKNGEELPKPLSSVEEKIKSEIEFIKSESYQKELKRAETYYASFADKLFYSAPWGIKELNEYRKKKNKPEAYTYVPFKLGKSQSKRTYFEIESALMKKIRHYCIENGVSLNDLIIFGYRTYCSAINERSSSVTVSNLVSRRRTFDDKNMGGCLTLSTLLSSNFSESDKFKDCIVNIKMNCMSSMRFSDITVKEQTQILSKYKKFSFLDGLSSMYISYIPYEGKLSSGESFNVNGYDTGYFGLSLYCIITDNITYDKVLCNYMHVLQYVPEWNVRELHENALRVIEAGIDDPDITVGELLDMVESKLIDHN